MARPASSQAAACAGIAGRRRGSSVCQHPGNLPTLRVACRCLPVAFDRQHRAAVVARASELRLGEQVQALVVKKGRVCGDTGSSLVQLYCESGGLHERARQVIAMMMVRRHCQEPVPEAAWTSLITACHRDGLLDEAVDVFRDMVSASVPRSSFSLSSILAVLAESENRQGRCGRQVHADAIKRGADVNQFVASGLVHMYARQGRLVDAARAFEAVGGKPDAVCWNAMAMAYARGGRYREAARVMYQMKAAGMNPSEEMTDAVRLACFR